MGRPNRNCCGSQPEPPEACSLTGESIPAHPSAGSGRVVSSSASVLDVTELLLGCTGSVTIGNSTIGRHQLAITVASTQPLWAALVIVWLDTPASFDPTLIGSINGLSAGTSLKIQRAQSSDPGFFVAPPPFGVPTPAPWLIGGVAIEQAGTTFVAINAPHMPLPVNPCCWLGLGFASADSHCAAGGVAFVPSHGPLPSNQSSSTETVLSGTSQLCPDRFGALTLDGGIDREQRPRLDQHDGLPFRVGVVVGLASHAPNRPTQLDGAVGDWSIEALTSPFCGGVSTAAWPHIGGPATAPVPPGQLLIDETFAAGLPVGWQTFSPVCLNDDATRPLFGGSGAVWTARDNMLVMEAHPATNQEYASGVAYIPITIPPGPYSDDFQLTIEATWQRINDQDRRFELAEGWHPETIRSQSCGVFAYPFGKAVVEHQIWQQAFGEPLRQQANVLITRPVTPLGGTASGVQQADAPYGWPCPCAEFPQFKCQNTSTGSYGSNPSIANGVGCGGGSIEDGTRLTFVVRRKPSTAPRGCLGFEWRHRMYSAAVYLNGRKVLGYPYSEVFGWTWNNPEIRVGVIAHWGGAWKDFRCYLQT